MYKYVAKIRSCVCVGKERERRGLRSQVLLQSQERAMQCKYGYKGLCKVFYVHILIEETL